MSKTIRICPANLGWIFTNTLDNELVSKMKDSIEKENSKYIYLDAVYKKCIKDEKSKSDSFTKSSTVSSDYVKTKGTPTGIIGDIEADVDMLLGTDDTPNTKHKTSKQQLQENNKNGLMYENKAIGNYAQTHNIKIVTDKRAKYVVARSDTIKFIISGKMDGYYEDTDKQPVVIEVKTHITKQKDSEKPKKSKKSNISKRFIIPKPSRKDIPLTLPEYLQIYSYMGITNAKKAVWIVSSDGDTNHKSGEILFKTDIWYAMLHRIRFVIDVIMGIRSDTKIQETIYYNLAYRYEILDRKGYYRCTCGKECGKIKDHLLKDHGGINITGDLLYLAPHGGDF